jgi:uncharacterized membrane protein
VRRTAPALLVALAVRLPVIAATDRVVADVKRYERMGSHLLDVSANPYETRHLYPYPPPWAAVEAGAEWLARRDALSFPVAVKLPVLAFDLGIVAVLGALAAIGRASPLAPWLYAVHPVAVLVGSAHGQFDALPLFFVLLSLLALARGRRDASALALGGAVAWKSFPVLLLPFFALDGRASGKTAARYALLASAPAALLVLPFLAAGPGAVGRELLSYSGVADFGWTGAVRGTTWLWTGTLARSEAVFWPAAAAASKVLFLGSLAALVALVRSGRLRLPVERACLAVVLGFLTLYGLLSAQYLLWAVPLGLLRPGRWTLAYGAAASAGLVGFYLFLADGVLLARPVEGFFRLLAGRLWAAGVLAVLVSTLLWLLAELREGRRATTEAR